MFARCMWEVQAARMTGKSGFAEAHACLHMCETMRMVDVLHVPCCRQ